MELNINLILLTLKYFKKIFLAYKLIEEKSNEKNEN